MEVRIKSIRPNPWSGIKKYPNCSDTFRAYLSRSGRKHTGLTEEDADRLGNLLNENLKPNSRFWKTFHVKLNENDLVLDTNDPFNELKYLFLKGHKRIANSIREIEPGTFYYISIEEEEAKVSNEYSRTKRKAYKEFDKLSKDDIRKALRLYGYKSNNLKDEVAEDRLSALLESNPTKFFELWVDNKNRQTEFLLVEAVSKNVIRKNKNMYSYGSTSLGKNKMEAIAFLDDKNNSDIKAAIINESKIK